MTTTDKILIWQTIISALTFLGALGATFLVYKIGKKQNEINQIFKLKI